MKGFRTKIYCFMEKGRELCEIEDSAKAQGFTIPDVRTLIPIKEGVEIIDRKLDPAPPKTTTTRDNFITCCK